MTTDLPHTRNGFVNFGIEDSLDKLNGILARNDITVDDMDERTVLGKNLSLLKPFGQSNEHELDMMILDTMRDRNNNDVDKFRSDEIDEFNRRYEVNLENDNPTFIFPDDRKSHNFVNMIRKANQSYMTERDLYHVPPPQGTTVAPKTTGGN